MPTTALLEYKETADLLRLSKSQVIDEWVRRIRAVVPAANIEDRPSLIDSLPEALTLLADSLDGSKYEAKTVKAIAREHGEQRADLGSYSIEQVVLEYQVLREVLIETLRPALEKAPGAHEIIHRFVDQGIRTAAGRFSVIERHQQSMLTASIEAERRQLEDVFQQSPIPMILFMNAELRVTLINEPGLTIMRKTRSEVEGRTFLEVASGNPLEAQRFLKLLNQVLGTGIPFVGKEVKYQYSTPAGVFERWVDLSYYPYYQKERVVGVIAYIQDVSEKVIARRKVEESDLRSREVAHEFNDYIMQAPSPMVILLGPEYVCTIANPAYERLVGRKVIGKTLAQVFNEKEVRYFRPLLDEVYRTGTPFIGKEIRMYLPDEEGVVHEHFLDLGYYPFRSRDGEIRGISADVKDVTDQVLARRKVEESESRYCTAQRQLNLALESARMGTWTFDMRTGQVTYSDIMSEISGLPTTVMTNSESAAKLVHPDDIERVRCAFRTALERNEEYVDEYRIVQPNGTIRWVFSRGTMAPGPDGKPAVFAGLFGDITERKNSEAALLDEQRKLETIFQVSPACMALWTGPNFVFEKLNSEYQQLFDDRELLGKPLLEAVPELEGQPFAALLKDVLETGQPFVANEALVQLARKKDGPLEDRYFDFKYVRVYDSNGQPFGIYGHAVDVTDRVEGRKQLSASQDRLKIATESARIGTFIFDPRSMRFSLSNRSCEILGLSIRDSHSLNELARTLVSEDGDSLREQVTRLLDPEAVGTLMVDNKVMLPNGETRYVFTTAQNVIETDNNGKRVTSIIGTHMDITERVRLKQDLEKAKIAADEANHSKSAFLANMSHEIRTPLGAILGFSSLLKEAALTPAERDRYVDTIARNGIALTHIIDDILDLAKVEAGRLDVETVTFSIYELMTDVVDLFRDKAKQKQIYVLLNVDRNLPAQLSSDPTRLRQILINLIGNAVKFTETGGVRVSVRATKVDADRATVEIAVKDSGIGLTDEQKHKLFQPFVQADNSTTRKFGGTGLGLVLSQRLSHALGGHISISDDCGSGNGCTFTLTFNASLPAPSLRRPRTKKTIAQSKAGALNNIRVLVVDDSLDNQFLVTHLLEKNGAKVETAGDGREALKKATEGTHDVILMDIQMPTMDGYQAKKALDEFGYGKPVIALTAHAMAEERVKTKQAGFAGHLTKPLAADELLETVAMLAKQFEIPIITSSDQSTVEHKY